MIAPDIDAATQALLPGCTFADRYALAIPGAPVDAREAAERAFSRSPRWVEALGALRNLLVAPLGLKPGVAGANKVGIFPVVSQSPDRLVLGLDDRHLDFRLVVDAVGHGGGTLVSATTLVRPHNALGRFYLGLIMPFHRLIAPAQLAGALRCIP